MAEERFTAEYGENCRRTEEALRLKQNFDIATRSFRIADRKACVYFVDVFTKDDVMEKILEKLLALTSRQMAEFSDAGDFAEHCIPYTEVSTQTDLHEAVVQVLSGQLLLLVEGFAEGVLIDLRDYPGRGVAEPEDERVLRGAHDGFTEAVKLNTALIRRRIRDTRLCMEALTVGEQSRTDVALCYMDGIADPQMVKRLRHDLHSICIPSLTMGQESLAECLFRKQPWNPFPNIRYTERPDHAAAALLEGKIVVAVDNSPVVMILPTAIFDFVQDTNEYYFPPLVGTFLRAVRVIIFMSTLFLVPVWYLFVTRPETMPDWLSFMKIQEPNNIPLFFQLLFVELIIDGVKIASLNTPSSLSNAFSIVGALILGEFAVNASLVVQEVLLYLAFVSVATFVQPSFRLGYAFKLFRIFFILLAAFFGWWGFAAGCVLFVLALVFTHTFGGYRYLYPLIPFNGQACLRLLFRRSVHHENS